MKKRLARRPLSGKRQRFMQLCAGASDLNAHAAEHLLAVESELNALRRIVLNDQPPQQLFDALLAS